MKVDCEEQTEFAAWINKEKRIVAFRKTEGCDKQIFRTQEEKMAYVYNLCESGYRIL